jgi:hypothetical protein
MELPCKKLILTEAEGPREEAVAMEDESISRGKAELLGERLVIMQSHAQDAG